MLTLILGTVIFVGIYYFVGKEKDPMKESLKQAKNQRLEREYGYVPSVWTDLMDGISSPETRELRKIRRELRKLNIR